ncbi:hypothetical protein [Grimontia sp. SpTr1]|uniref:hypothetical protein n=1 Tax=Grimontia sp. SpTr1 TaxID=2995319 RepID=UPI00248D0B93|nr:hypothetical protein [Grimontia sp. SpTr1]
MNKKLNLIILIVFLSQVSLANEKVNGQVSKAKETISIDELEVSGLGLATVGMRVMHSFFGEGVIVDIAEFPDKTHTINVDFIDNGTKWLVPEYANLLPAK